MTQHYFNATLSSGKSVDVLIGWDRCLQECFLIIMCNEPKSQQGNDDGIVYSNDYDLDARNQGFEYFMTILSTMDIAAPDGLLEALQEDRDSNAGNIIRDWDEG